MPVVVIRTGMLRALEYEFDHIVDGCVLGIPGSFTNVVEAPWNQTSALTLGCPPQCQSSMAPVVAAGESQQGNLRA